MPNDWLDDVGLIYHYAREAWQMGAILLGQDFDLPELWIKAFSTNRNVEDSAYWYGPNTGFDPVDPIIRILKPYIQRL